MFPKKRCLFVSNENDDEERRNFTIYNVPESVVSDFVSLAKVHYDNEGWRAFEECVDTLIAERNSRIDELEEAVARLEAQVKRVDSKVDALQDQSESKDEPPVTMGE